jgi:5-methyltetrahydrofolate--homocysteine methyltransferase
MTTREHLNAIAGRRILVLDGAMGTMIQSFRLGEADFRGGRFAAHHSSLLGCNDILCLTRPDVISAIHEAYLEAGADIIEACSFNATAVSLADYGVEALSYEISAAAAVLARRAAEKFSTPDKPRFAAGSIGSTVKSASLSPDMNDPAKRGIYWDELEAAYYEHVRGLLDGGVDILLVETVYDTLNAKAALSAIGRLLEERNADVPVMISATVSGDSGRLLSGQTLEAFCVSVFHARPWAIGLNCSFGAEKLLPHVRTVAAQAAQFSCLVSAHPNAGLPNQLGGYDETPETMAASVEQYLKEGLVHIVGGCCGSTPAHIAAIAAKVASYIPRPVASEKALSACSLAGLEPFLIGGQSFQGEADSLNSLAIIGERTNVAGSRRFLSLISGKKYDEALAFARDTIKAGASLINIGMDDAMLDAEQAMADFLDIALSDPDIARVPFMIDSSRWNVIETGLKRVQGKSLVNSINLKDGEKEFLRRAGLIRRYGAAVVVMLIDGQGQAVSYERKIEIAGRAYGLLIAAGFPAGDIVFDPNVLAVATGISEHDSCALDFIRACSWIRDNCPGVQISGGVSNLSFSFRGNNVVREAMHSVFLHHAVRAGLSMAIVNPAALVLYNEIDGELRDAVEDVILNRRPDAAETLLSIAERIAAEGSRGGSGRRAASRESGDDWRSLDAEGRIIHAMVKGLDDYIEADLPELLKKYSPLALVEGPLMDGMKEVGRRFGEGTMYLPQVIRSARVMKKAVAVLEPYMNLSENSAVSADAGAPRPKKILLATVKGDVHDIGKNIVGIVLGCNGYKIIDLGVMVPAEQIFEAAEKENADVIGLSGLISPSLDEMVYVAREMEKRKMNIPLLIGGAAASLVHTALRIAPEYSGPVVYVPDVGKSAETVRALLSAARRPRFLADLANSYRTAAARHEAIQSRRVALSPEEARANKIPPASYTPVKPKKTGLIELNGYPLDSVIPYIDWRSFLAGWDIQKEKRAESEKLLADAKALLERIKSEEILTLRGVTGIFPAAGDNEEVVVFGPDTDNAHNAETARFCFLRAGGEKTAGVFNPCLADFLKPLDNDSRPADWLGLFALSAGFGLREKVLEYRTQGDDYSAILLTSLANALTEAFVEEVHFRVRREWWGYAAAENLTLEDVLKGKYTGIRPAFGYPACPDHEDKRAAFALLEARERCGLELTASAMMIPSASVCGMFFASPASCYFSVGAQGDGQLNDWAKRKGISVGEARRRTGI